jgi:hypothetical protein
VAFGDVDNDGDVDVLVGNNNGPTRLLINNVLGGPSGRAAPHWIGLRLLGEGGRDMLSARVEVIRKNGPPLTRRVRADGSYASANDPRVLVGLGDSAEAVTVRVRWPSGKMETWSDLQVGRYITLHEGSGK